MWNQPLKMMKKLRNRALRWVFDRYYGHFLYPFIKADEVWLKKTENEQWLLYQQISDWINSEAYKIEYESLVREFYQKLAVESQTEEQVLGYRLALLALKTWDIRLKGLAQKFTEIKILEQKKRLIK